MSQFVGFRKLQGIAGPRGQPGKAGKDGEDGANTLEELEDVDLGATGPSGATGPVDNQVLQYQDGSWTNSNAVIQLEACVSALNNQLALQQQRWVHVESTSVKNNNGRGFITASTDTFGTNGATHLEVNTETSSTFVAGSNNLRMVRFLTEGRYLVTVSYRASAASTSFYAQIRILDSTLSVSKDNFYGNRNNDRNPYVGSITMMVDADVDDRMVGFAQYNSGNTIISGGLTFYSVLKLI